MTAKVLIIDDEDLFREDLASLLSAVGHECRTAPNGNQGLAMVQEFGPDVILCDLVMPDKGGMEVLEQVMVSHPETCVVMLTAYATLETAVDAFRKGASDYIMKPVLIEDVLGKIQRIMTHRRLTQEVKFLRRHLSEEGETGQMVGLSAGIRQVQDLIKKAGPTRSTVLVTGESGTGKELVARAIHQIDPGKRLPFVAINCAGIPEHLLESELFGHMRGAFTGAVDGRQGFFELAGEGTLLLDEIAEMPPRLQAKLLRVLEEREFFPVGGTQSVQLRARIIASTNRHLPDLVEEGRFREDLFFRIAVFEIHVPALRERRSDVPLLVDHFVTRFSAELKRRCLGVDDEAMRCLMAYAWPGNVREVRNIVERAMILSSGDYLSVADLPPQLTGAIEFAAHADNLRDATRAYEKEHISRVLQASGGNKEEAARRLGVNPSTLYRKMADPPPDADEEQGPST